MSVNGISGDWLRIAAQGHKEQNFAGLSKTLKDLNLMIHDVVMFCKLCQVSVVMLHSRENLQECDHCSVDLLYMTHDSFCLPLPSALCATDRSYLTFPIYHILFQIRTHIIDWQEVL